MLRFLFKSQLSDRNALPIYIALKTPVVCMTGKCQNRLQLHEISIAFKGSFQSVHLFHVLRKLLKADTTGRGE